MQKIETLKKQAEKYAKKCREYNNKCIDVKNQIIKECSHPKEHVYDWYEMVYTGNEYGGQAYCGLRQCTICGLRESSSTGGYKLKEYGIQLPRQDYKSLPEIIKSTFVKYERN